MASVNQGGKIKIVPGDSATITVYAQFDDGTLPDLTAASGITACFPTSDSNVTVSLGSGITAPGSPTNKAVITLSTANTADFRKDKTTGFDFTAVGSWGTKSIVFDDCIEVIDKNC